MSFTFRSAGPFASNAGFRPALGRAREEAVTHRHQMIRPVHIFLGTLLTPDLRTEAVLAALGVSTIELTGAVYRDLGRPLPAESSGPDLAFTQHGKTILERACLYAESLGWGWLGAVHLLYAVHEHHWGTARRVLRDTGIAPTQLRHVIESVARRLPPDPSDEPAIVWYVTTQEDGH